MIRSRELTNVATLLSPAEQSRLDAASQGLFRPFHSDTIDEVCRVVRERPFSALLISPGCVDQRQMTRVAQVVTNFPGLTTFALVSRADLTTSERLLQLGASGVNRLIDVSLADGWRRLREILSDPSTPTMTRIAKELYQELQDCTRPVQRFFDSLVRLSPVVSTAKEITQHFGVHPSTFMSRFYRAGLPSPKRYLAGMRLIHAAALFETNALSITDVAYRLEYSSPQSFGRHTRNFVGLTASQFRRDYPFERALDSYLSRLVRPFRADLRVFDPFGATSGSTRTQRSGGNGRTGSSWTSQRVQGHQREQL